MVRFWDENKKSRLEKQAGVDSRVLLRSLVSTGTGILIPNEWAMQEGDLVEIEIERIGVLSNVARRLTP